MPRNVVFIAWKFWHILRLNATIDTPIIGAFEDAMQLPAGRQISRKFRPPRHLVDGREAAILLLRDIELRGKGRDKPMTRVQLTGSMLRRLWNRPRLSPEFLDEVSAWLAVGGWCFFNVGPMYAAVRMSAVKNWPRLGTSRIEKELNEVASGEFPFEDHERLLIEDTAGDLDRRREGEMSEGEHPADTESNEGE
jgi:hypothetical protein